MPYSYSQPSSSEASLSDGGWAEADGDFGVPTQCYCGAPVVVEVSNEGRKYYKCELSEVPRTNGRPHIYKCWDLAMEEEVTKLRQEIDELKKLLALAKW